MVYNIVKYIVVLNLYVNCASSIYWPELSEPVNIFGQFSSNNT